MATTPKKSNARWPEGWRPLKRARGVWCIYGHEIQYANRSWRAWCWKDPAHRKEIADSLSTNKQDVIDRLVAHMKTCQPWKPYERFIVNTGGHPIERVGEVKTKASINLPLFFAEVAVSSQLALLRRLDAEGLLKHPQHDPYRRTR